MHHLLLTLITPLVTLFISTTCMELPAAAAALVLPNNPIPTPAAVVALSTERGHNQDKPYTCFMCPKRFAWQSHLVKHERTHTGERPFKCAFECGKTFADKTNCKRHERTHTGERPFQCDQCPRKFTRNSTLQKHAHELHGAPYPQRSKKRHTEEIAPIAVEQNVVEDDAHNIVDYFLLPDNPDAAPSLTQSGAIS